MTIFSCERKKQRPNLYIPDAARNLAEINYDSQSTIRYTLINNGHAALKIDTATASCGCTVPNPTRTNVPAGDSSFLLVSCKPVDTGPFDKRVVIKSNTDSGFSTLSFQGKAVK